MDKDVLIQKYLQGKLNEAEEQLFQEYMENDPTFANEIPFHEDLNYAFAKADYDQTKAQLQSFYKEEKQSVWRKWSIAASVIVLLGLGSLWYVNSSDTTQNLYAQYFEPYKNTVQPIVRGETTKNMKILAFTAYDDGAYEKAIGFFDDLLASNPDPVIAFYKANAQMKIGKTNAAIETLKSRIQKTDTIYGEAQWYLALGYLKLEDAENAKKSLKEFLETNTRFKREAARELLKALE